MSAVKRLDSSEISQRLLEVPKWTMKEEALVREFKFPDFVSAFGFMTVVAFRAEERNHHPNWSNVYNSVSVSLSTHDVGGVTEKDFALAKVMDELAVRF